MKKTIALILAIVMMAALAVPAFAAAGVETAAPKTTDAGYSAEATVKYGVAKTYTVTLPTTIDFDTTLAIAAPISASNVVIAGNETLTVALQSDFSMTCTNCTPVGYTVKVTDKDQAPTNETPAVANEGIVLSVPASTTPGTPASGEKQLNFSTAGTSQAGQYSDTITFVIAIVAA